MMFFSYLWGSRTLVLHAYFRLHKKQGKLYLDAKKNEK